ncbi:UDP-diphosphatase [Flavipsychrobacter stenotrophus]|uniref:Undecaprenyl-diphosphatase n=1 Tax=Flavipsychrobacter stenotrophus TaxID=2077091 RepID=A0A2S7SVP5_9BACT|nr:undecaprenyl-diphosphate phosphatase [Flavipsychrobacter stenotrophus]PQJ10606.1 UDP-diphosphatase [Flavipsychrobacter stenotrophus]
MTWLQSIVIAVIEGVTEFLPISSTAHIKFTKAIMGMDPHEAFSNMFDIVIQFAAVMAVIVLYWKKFLDFKGIAFYVKLIIAVIPALVFGLLLKKHINNLLGNVTVIACITVLGGVVLLFVDSWFKKPEVHDEERITNAQALKVGLCQILSIIFPGLSRSASTIIGGMAAKLDKKVAAEFSFFLAVPTMAAATAKDILDTYKKNPEVFHNTDNLGMLVVGCLVSFIVSVLAIKSFITYVQKHSFRAFGVYRIIAGLAILALIYTGVIKKEPKETVVPKPAACAQHVTESYLVNQ